MGFQKPTGTQDLLPGKVETWQYIEEKARAICSRFNFKEIRTPLFEQTDLFTRGVGETTDIVQKEMYTFLDKGERSMTLRPEGTAGVVRSYVENKLYGDPDITKLFYIGAMFRYERPQAGRFRQFHQFGVEAFGSVDPSLDAEVIALGYLLYKELGLTGVKVEINSVGTPEVRANYKSKLQEFLLPVKDKLCKDCQLRFDKNPLRLLDCKVDQEYFVGAPSILDSLDEECEQQFEAVKGHLTAMGVNYVVNPRMVRGLDYYTHTAFEYKCEGIGSIDTIGGGGRYNGLVADVGGPDQPGVGLGLGLERLVLILENQKVAIPAPKTLDMYLVALGEAAEKEITRLLYQLRCQGVTAEKDYGGRKMKAQMKSADRLNARYVAILGDDELERGVITLKSMGTGEQEVLDLENFIEKFLNKQ